MSPTSAQDQFSLERIPSRIQSAKRIASVDGNVWYVFPPDCGKLAAIDTDFQQGMGCIRFLAITLSAHSQSRTWTDVGIPMMALRNIYH